MTVQPRVSATAFLIADPARAAMLMALADGRALPAGELAYAAGVTAQTASSHLAKLLDGGLLAVEKEGRHRYYRLADAQVGALLESLATVGARATIRRKPLGQEARTLRFARCCYDHLAGQLGVAITGRLTEAGLIAEHADKRFVVTAAGTQWFGDLGLDVAMLKPGRLGIARQCLDWTERQHHLAGPLGVAWLALMCERGWMRRQEGSRAVLVTQPGWRDLRDRLGLTPDSIASSDNDSDG
ncbi:ArsR/SmtB family transcription factor [Paraburkholderia acidisoli]|uniref:Metalloregulator ArsR/SmtB family transcription factor n=1 Tax=Paraburkholderia acidisoli TaxID=2571748 RepID=A0A7Z2GK17_9BURK|nr:helix-turn-helix domain-containing protein [Paraburkholderia acidisoli]QGZ63148.1 metalloregulator ArsR/SmtB family transcription factor [Paraburkholderia acidisoli]